MQADNIAASAWMDSKVVTAMFNGYDPAEVTTILRRQKDGTRNSVPCPVAIADYNVNMGGVDRGDRFVGITLPNQMQKVLQNFLVGVSLTNSFILQHLGHPGSKLSLKKFQELVAKQLIGDYCCRRKVGRVSLSTRHLSIQHFPQKGVSSTSDRKRGRCFLCSEKNKRRDTQWFCKECGIWLCHPGTASDCFLLWHQRRQTLSPLSLIFIFSFHVLTFIHL